MTNYVAIRDGGKTGESGASRFQAQITTTFGVMGATDLQVVQRGAGANMSVDVNTGDLILSYLEYSFHVWATATNNVVVSGNTSGNPRVDAIVAYVDLAVVDSTSSNNPGALKFTIVAGTPAVSPTAPVDATIQAAIGASNPFLRLANVAVANAAASIVTANITDTRTQYLMTAALTGATSLNLSPGQMINGKIVTSVSSNNITVALKGMNGSDPSATNVVYVRIGDTLRTVTSALSVTKNAGTNWFNSGASETATQEIDYFVYLGYNTTDGVVLGFARFPTALKYSDFSATTTNAKYCAISTITTAASTDDYVNIGRFNAILSATASFNWSIPATSIIINAPTFITRTLVCSPTYTGFSANPTNVAARYSINGFMLEYMVRMASSGTSNLTTFTVTAPFVSATVSNAVWGNLCWNAFNGGADSTTIDAATITSASSTVTLLKNNSSTGWTNSLGKAANFQIRYEI